MSSVEKLSFQISGDYFTTLLRDVFVEDGFGKAYQIFKESFDGVDVSILISILKCEKKFEGVNEFKLVNDSPEDNESYIKDVNFRYECLCTLDDGMHYRPKRIIEGFHPVELQDRFVRDELVDFGEKIVEIDGKYYIFERAFDVLPFWIESCKTPKDALKNYLKYHTLSTFSKEHFEEINDPYRIYKNFILKQANGNFIELKYWVGETEKSIKIPEAPFHLWCLGRDKNCFFDEIKWDPVCPQGLKTSNDNVYHSDWVLGAGLNLNDWYELIKFDEEYKNIDAEAWGYAFKYSLKKKKERGMI